MIGGRPPAMSPSQGLMPIDSRAASSSQSPLGAPLPNGANRHEPIHEETEIERMCVQCRGAMPRVAAVSVSAFAS
jgi:hypothetical protein